MSRAMSGSGARSSVMGSWPAASTVGSARSATPPWTRSARTARAAPTGASSSTPGATSVKAAGKPIPVVTGQDSEVESVKSIMAGEQYSTINKDTRTLVADTIKMVEALQKGEKPNVNDEKSYNNGVKVVPANLLAPVIVTKANAAEAYANDPTLSPLTK